MKSSEGRSSSIFQEKVRRKPCRREICNQKRVMHPDTERFMSDKPVLVDARGMFSEEEAKKKGFYYRRL